MKHKQQMVNRSAQDRRRLDAGTWTKEERRTKEEKRKQWQRTSTWRSKHKPIKDFDLSKNQLL